MTNTLAPARPRQWAQWEQAIDYTGLDERIAAHTIEECPVVDEICDKVSEDVEIDHGTLDALWFDAYNSLCKNNPRDTGMGLPLNRELLDRMRNSERYEELRSATVADEVASALAAATLTDQVVRYIPEDTKNKAEQYRKAERQLQDARGYAEVLDEDEDADGDERREAWEDVDEKASRAKRALKMLNRSIRDNGQEIGQAVVGATSTTAEEVGSFKVACDVFGIGSGQVNGGLSSEEKFRLASIVQDQGPKFRKLIEILGRMQRLALSKQASKAYHEAGEIVDIEIGSSINRFMDIELATLTADGDLQLLALSRFANSQCFQYDVRQKETKGRGDIVVLFDESSSMRGQREAEAKGVALALAHIAMRQRRSFRCLFFQSRVTCRVEIDPGDARRMEDGVSVALRKMGEIAARGTGGGTSLDEPLREACGIVSANERADVLVLTDGIAALPEATVERVNGLRRETGAHFYSMLIGASSSGLDTLSRFSDRVWLAESLFDKAAPELFEIV